MNSHSNQLLFQINPKEDINDVVKQMVESWNKKDKLNSTKPTKLIVSDEEVLTNFKNDYEFEVVIIKNRPKHYIYMSK